MQNVIEYGIVMLFGIVIILLASCIALLTIKCLFIYPFSKYYIQKPTNKIQWKAVETDSSKEIRLNHPNHTIGKNIYEVYYRILPSELPFLVKVFDFNKWQNFNTERALIFNEKENFVDFVSKFKTYADVKNYYKEFDNKITWMYP